MSLTTLAAAFTAGALGGVQCAGMCSGIVSAFSFHAPANGKPWLYHLSANTGRIAGYAAIGAVAGAIGAGGQLVGELLPAQKILLAGTNAMVLLLGLHIAGLRVGLAKLDVLGRHVFRVLPVGFSGARPDSLLGAITLGVLWGWLPCGLVYATLILALMSGSALDGATILAAFGLGTLPNVLALAFAANWVSAAARNVNVRRAAGFITAAFGLAGLSRVAGIPLDAVALAELCFTR